MARPLLGSASACPDPKISSTVNGRRRQVNLLPLPGTRPARGLGLIATLATNPRMGRAPPDVNYLSGGNFGASATAGCAVPMHSASFVAEYFPLSRSDPGGQDRKLNKLLHFFPPRPA